MVFGLGGWLRVDLWLVVPVVGRSHRVLVLGVFGRDRLLPLHEGAPDQMNEDAFNKQAINISLN